MALWPLIRFIRSFRVVVVVVVVVVIVVVVVVVVVAHYGIKAYLLFRRNNISMFYVIC